MKRSILFSFILMGILTLSCNNKKQDMQDGQNETTFVHTVFFWLNDTASEAEKLAFESGLEILGTVPSIGNYYYGLPAGTPRDVVDNSYDYALIVHFPNAEAQDEYQEHEIHLEFIDKYQHLWKHVKVYDTILED